MSVSAVVECFRSLAWAEASMGEGVEMDSMFYGPDLLRSEVETNC